MPTVQSNDATLYYEVHGRGPAVLFAHGRGGNATSWWQQIPFFAARYTCIPFDHRTFGRSHGGGENFSQPQLAADLIAILDAEGIGRAAVVAQSMGGWGGLGAALEFPERIACLVMTSTHGGLALGAGEALDPGAGKPLTGLAVAPGYAEREPEMALLLGQLRAFNTGFDAANMQKLRDPAQAIGPERLEGYHVPTLFIIAENDQIFPRALLRHGAARLPGAEVAEFPRAGHSPYWEDAPRFNEMVDEFLTRHHRA